VYFRHSTRRVGTSPFGRMTLTGGGAYMGEHRIQRFIFDTDRHFFGYDLVFDSAGGTGGHRLVFEPLSLKPHQLLPPIDASREELSLSRLPPPQTLRLGRALEFSLSTADGKHKVIERIEFSRPPKAEVPRS